MTYITISSGLTLKWPTKGTTNWNDTMYAEFAQKISAHDHTGSGKGLQIGSSALAANAVTTAKITDGNVTLAKLANIATDRLIGRDTASSGVPEALTVGGGVEFTGSGGIQRSALTGDITASAGSNTTALSADAATRSAALFHCQAGLADGDTAEVEQPILGTLGVVFRASMPKAGKVTHLTFNLREGLGLASGALYLVLYKNGVSTGKSINLAVVGETQIGSIVAESFVAGDRLSFATDLNAATFTSGGTNLVGTAWGHFTE